MSIRIGLGRLRNQVSAVKNLQTPSRTTTTTTILVAFVVLNKLLYSNLVSGACAEGFLGGLQAVRSGRRVFEWSLYFGALDRFAASQGFRL